MNISRSNMAGITQKKFTIWNVQENKIYGRNFSWISIFLFLVWAMKIILLKADFDQRTKIEKNVTNTKNAPRYVEWYHLHKQSRHFICHHLLLEENLAQLNTEKERKESFKGIGKTHNSLNFYERFASVFPSWKAHFFQIFQWLFGIPWKVIYQQGPRRYLIRIISAENYHLNVWIAAYKISDLFAFQDEIFFLLKIQTILGLCLFKERFIDQKQGY